MEIIKTEIDGLEIRPQKMVGDHRGWLLEMFPGGMANPAVQPWGFGNLCASVATGKHIPRGGHYHYHDHEIFFTLTGSALWLFYDFREDSPTKGKIEGLITGAAVPPGQIYHTSYTVAEQKFVQVSVPVGVYHVFWPLTDEVVHVIELGSVPYDSADYWRGKPAEIPGFPEILKKYGIPV